MRQWMMWIVGLCLIVPAIGCGAGGAGGGDTLEITRMLLTGSESAATLTAKKWKTISMRANGNYVGTGGDQPCPVTLEDRSGSGSISCNGSDYVELRSDGKARSFSVEAGGLDTDFDDSWSVAEAVLGHVINRDGRTESNYSYDVTDAGIVEGKQRLRLRIRAASADGTSVPEDIGLESVIEELP